MFDLMWNVFFFLIFLFLLFLFFFSCLSLLFFFIFYFFFSSIKEIFNYLFVSCFKVWIWHSNHFSSKKRNFHPTKIIWLKTPSNGKPIAKKQSKTFSSMKKKTLKLPYDRIDHIKPCAMSLISPCASSSIYLWISDYVMSPIICKTVLHAWIGYTWYGRICFVTSSANH